MLSRRIPGFSLVEMLISVAIIGLLAVAVVASLNSGIRTEELKNSANQLAADIRSMQARALAAGEVKACPSGTGYAVCEQSTASCNNPAQCAGQVPSAFGLHASTTEAGYSLFAEVDSAMANYHYDPPKEQLLFRNLLKGESQNVIIQTVLTGRPAPLTPVAKGYGDVSFTRQNGTTRLDDGSGTEPDVMVIRLKNKLSNATKDIEINRVTGRVSILN